MSKRKATHGGRRENSGRGVFFRGKSTNRHTHKPMYDPRQISPPVSVLLTAGGRELLDEACEELTEVYQDRTGNSRARISRSVIVEALVRRYGKSLTLAQIEEEDCAARGE